jgi:hypothetical protein
VSTIAKYQKNGDDASSSEAIVAPHGASLALLFPLIPVNKVILGQPPSFSTVTRDTFPAETLFHPHAVWSILAGMASAAKHLHSRGICHGDLYAHNILIDSSCTSPSYPLIPSFDSIEDIESSTLFLPTLCDFGAASIFCTDNDWGPFVPMLEVRAFGCLIDDLVTRMRIDGTGSIESLRAELVALKDRCMNTDLSQRPSMNEIVGILSNTRHLLQA